MKATRAGTDLSNIMDQSGLSPEQIATSLEAYTAAVIGHEMVLSESVFATAMTECGIPPDEVRRIWDRKILIDGTDFGRGRRGLPGAARFPVTQAGAALTRYDLIREDLARAVRAQGENPALVQGAIDYEAASQVPHLPFMRQIPEVPSSPEGILAEDAGDVEQMSEGVIREVYPVGQMRRNRAYDLSSPFEGTSAEPVLTAQLSPGIMEANERWVKALVEHDGVSPEAAESIISARFNTRNLDGPSKDRSDALLD